MSFLVLKKTLVLDLDETLIHSTAFPRNDAQKVEVKDENGKPGMVNN